MKFLGATILGVVILRYFVTDRANVEEFQIVRGSVAEVKDKGFTQEEPAYPLIHGDYLIESPTKFRLRD